jgi:glycosyltransferase involved in cell wall biosynthesis
MIAMGDKSVFVSVLLPVRNGELYLQNAISSVLLQTYTNFELIIIDNSSTDASLSIMKKNANKDERIRIYSFSKIGIVNVLNFGLEVCSGDYIARIDCDDEWMPEKLEIQIRKFIQDPSLVLLGSSIILIDSNGYPIANQISFNRGEALEWTAIKKRMAKNNPFCHSSVVFRKKDIVSIGGYSNKFKHSEDYYLWHRVVSLYKSEIISNKLVKYRIHSNSITKKYFLRQQVNSLRVKARFCLTNGKLINNLYQLIYGFARLLKIFIASYKG